MGVGGGGEGKKGRREEGKRGRREEKKVDSILNNAVVEISFNQINNCDRFSISTPLLGYSISQREVPWVAPAGRLRRGSLLSQE